MARAAYSYFRFLAAFPAFDAEPNGEERGTILSFPLPDLGFFFSRLPLDMVSPSALPAPGRANWRQITVKLGFNRE